MKKLMLMLLLMTSSAYADNLLCSIDYASMNFVKKTKLISTDTNYLNKGLEKVEVICNKKGYEVEKDVMFVHGYFDGYKDGTSNDVIIEDAELPTEYKALIHVCIDTINRLRSIQVKNPDIHTAIEVEEALYNTQKFCRIAENQSATLAGYIDGYYESDADYSQGYNHN